MDKCRFMRILIKPESEGSSLERFNHLIDCHGKREEAQVGASINNGVPFLIQSAPAVIVYRVKCVTVPLTQRRRSQRTMRYL